MQKHDPAARENRPNFLECRKLAIFGKLNFRNSSNDDKLSKEQEKAKSSKNMIDSKQVWGLEICY